MSDLQVGFGRKTPGLKASESSGGMGKIKQKIMANRKSSEPPVLDTTIKMPEFKKTKIAEALNKALANLIKKAE